MSEVINIRERDWGEGILAPQAQEITDGIIANLANQLGLDTDKETLLSSTIREHTIRTAQNTQRTMMEDIDIPATGTNGGGAKVIQFTGSS